MTDYLTMQDILDKAMPRYIEWQPYGMCSVLIYFQVAEVISKKDYLYAKNEIDEYIIELAQYANAGKPAYLRHALKYARLPHENINLVTLYGDWENRPKPWIT